MTTKFFRQNFLHVTVNTAGILFLWAGIFTTPGSAFGADWFVSPSGSDDSAGTEDAPLATPAVALEKARHFRADHPNDAIRIRFLPGRFDSFATLDLGPNDSGTAENPLLLEGVSAPSDPDAPDLKRTIFDGSVPIGSWKKSTFRGLPNVWEADLTGTIFDAPEGETPRKIKILFLNDQRLTEARYPNFDPDFPYSGGYAYVTGKIIGKFDPSEGEDPTTIPLSPDDFRNWRHPEEGQVCFFNRYNYFNELAAIRSVDAASRKITLQNGFSVAARAPDRFFLFGLAEELDLPGEWYHDVIGRKLYLIPSEGTDLTTSATRVSAAATDVLIRLKDVRHLRIRGLSFTGAEGSAIQSVGEDNVGGGNGNGDGNGKETVCCKDVRIEKCRFYEMGYFHGSAVEMENTLRCGVVGCDFWNLGGYGVTLSGGDPYVMKKSGNFIENCYFHHTGRFNRHGFAMEVRGCGVRVSKNLCHDLPRGAIIYSGAFHLFENNRFRDLNTEVEDTGATYTDGNNWIGSRGSVIRRNHVKNSVGYAFSAGRYSFHKFAFGFYLDENCGGVDVYENLVEDCSLGALHLHNARDNHIFNNIFVHCGAENDNHGFQLSLQGWRDEPGETFYQRLPMMIDRYETATRLPAWRLMRGMIDPRSALGRPDKTIMTGNWVERNIFYFPNQPDSLYIRHDLCDLTANAFDWNLVWNGGKPIRTAEESPAGENLSEWEAWQRKGADLHSIVADPRFVDPASGDYRLKPDSPAFDLGFEPFPLEFGPIADPLRASWPIREAEGLREHPEWLRILRQPVESP